MALSPNEGLKLPIAPGGLYDNSVGMALSPNEGLKQGNVMATETIVAVSEWR